MKRSIVCLALAVLLAPNLARPQAPATGLAALSDEQVEARNRATQAAGAFQNEGFKNRDSFWAGSFKAGESKVIEVNLYAGNDYWFSLAATDKASKIKISIFDETGAVIPPDAVEIADDQERHTSSLAFAPAASGSFFVKIEEVEGDVAALCLVYSYK